jgi:anti-sigma factor RsiW
MPTEKRVQCPESLRVQAYFDAEVDALAGAEIERHLEHCTECRALRSRLEELRAALRRDVPYEHAPRALRRQVMQALDAESAADTSRQRRVSQTPSRWRSFWMGAASGFATAVATATVAFFVLALPFTNPVVDELLGAHVSSLMSSHLIDVVSTDLHTVKPWFAGRADVSPAVADFAAQGYQLTGGRVDNIGDQRAAVVVYQHGPHVINVFCWATDRGFVPKNATRRGYHLAFWKSGDLAYAAVSDTAWDELLGLKRLLQGLGRSDPPP